jgi:hypothetical protein
MQNIFLSFISKKTISSYNDDITLLFNIYNGFSNGLGRKILCSLSESVSQVAVLKLSQCGYGDWDRNVLLNKGNNKITELRTILQTESQNS